MALTNLLIDIYSSNYAEYFEELEFDEKIIEDLDYENLDRLTKLAAVIEYVGNRQTNAKLYNWIYSSKLKLENPYTPGVKTDSIERVRRIFSASREFAQRNVFFDEETLKPI